MNNALEDECSAMLAIQILGRKEGLGKPLLYGTTTGFLKDFNLKSIKDLPKIGEIKGDEFSLEE